MRRKQVFILFIIIILFPYCKKQNTSINYNANIEVVCDYVDVSYMTSMIMNTYFKAINDSLLFADGSNTIDGATVTLSNDSTEISFHYVSWSTPDGYGNKRAGNIIALSDNGFFVDGSQINLQFEDFYFNFDTITSSGITIINNGDDSLGNKFYTIGSGNIARSFCDTSGTTIYSFNLDVDYSFENGDEYFSLDDIINTTGSFSGTSKKNISFSGVIDSVLKTRYSCNYINGGYVTLNTPSLNFNSGCFFNSDTCSDLYNIVINDIEFRKTYSDN